MIPDTIIVTDIDKNDLSGLAYACKEFMNIHYVPANATGNLAQACAEALMKRVMKKLLDSQVKSIQLSRIEYRTIMTMYAELMSPRSGEALHRFVREIHPKIC